MHQVLRLYSYKSFSLMIIFNMSTFNVISNSYLNFNASSRMHLERKGKLASQIGVR